MTVGCYLAQCLASSTHAKAEKIDAGGVEKCEEEVVPVKGNSPVCRQTYLILFIKNVLKYICI